MSNPALEALLKFCQEQGLTPEVISDIKDEELAGLPGPSGAPFTKIQIALLRADSRKKEKEKEREIEKLQKENEDLKRKANADKVRASQLIVHTQQMISRSAAQVLRMMADVKRLGSNLDICFCMDGTGSMLGCIQKVKKCISQVATNISASTGMSSRFALVIYRDYCDRAKRHQIWGFDNSSAIQSHLNLVDATGGGDGPEDCFGGIWAAITQISWEAPTKVIIWIGDAPQHGTQYNGGMADDYPSGDPDGRTAVEIFRELQNRHIDLVFGKLRNSTDAMCARLRTEVAPFGSKLFQEYNVGPDMEFFLATSIHKTVMLTAEKGTLPKGPEKQYTLTSATWAMDEKWGPEEEAEILTFSEYRGKELHPLLDLVMDGPDTKKRNARCRITLNPVENGEMRYAFYCKIIGSSWRLRTVDLKCVTKESRYEGCRNTKQALIDQASIQAVALLLAADFSAKLRKIGVGRKLIYVPVEILRIPSRPEDKRYFTLEAFIPGDYVKFNNNKGFVDKPLEASHPVLQTFSHFTYSYSRGMIMVVDLQGVVEDTTYKLTDPAIHTADPKKCLRDPTNLGSEGMSAFFDTHECNSVCRLLDLKRPEEIGGMAPLDISEAEVDESDVEEIYTPFGSE